MRALFGRKVMNLEELRDLTEAARRQGRVGSIYQVTKEMALGDLDFREFAEDFFKDQPWIGKDDGGSNPNGEIRCIRGLTN